MPTIDKLTYGYDKAGVESYLEAIHNTYLLAAEDAVEDTSKIKTICEEEWEGKARDKFLENLAKDAEYVSTQLEALYTILNSEIKAVQSAMANKDENLIS